MKHSIWEILNMAGYAMWVILALSILAIAVAIERLAVQWRFMLRARALHDTVSRCLTRGALDEARSACERSRSPLADVYLVGYERLGRTKKDHLASAVNRERMRVMIDLKSRLWMLGTIGAIGVFVGLYGTVIGIMNAFQLIEETGRNDFAEVAGPIAEALYATAAGILVAVEAVVLYNFFNQRLSRLAVEFKMLTDEFLELLDELEPQPGRTGSPDEGEGGGEAAKESGHGSREAA
jgi:biopolymer transport protein ExbB/TolQ